MLKSKRIKSLPKGAPSPTFGTDDESQKSNYNFNLTRLSQPEMVKLATYFIMIVKGKIPAKRSEIIKYAMNKQAKDFPKVIKQTGKGLRKVFGLRLIGVKAGRDDIPMMCDHASMAEATSYFVSTVKIQPVVARIHIPDRSFEKDAIQAALFLILACIYMVDVDLDEDTVWHILEKMNFTKALQLRRREDLRKFLKTAYVDPLYLVKHETKLADGIIARYDWGIRADTEISKLVVLKFVAKTVNRNPNEFTTHFSRISEMAVDNVDEEEKNGKMLMMQSSEASLD